MLVGAKRRAATIGDQMIEIPFSDFVLHQKNDRISALNPGIPAWGAGDKSPSHR